MKRIVFLSLFVVVSLLSFNGCDDENRFLSDEKDKPAATDSIPKTDSIQISIVLNYDSLLLYVGESDKLIATVRNGEIIINNKVTWSTDNALVAEVDSNGVVTALSVGAAVITVTYQGVNYNCNVFVTERSSAYEYVDLGLSVYWATCNIGATEVEEFGNYYGWGEVEPKQYYSYYNYRFYDGGELILDRQAFIPVNPYNIKLSKYNTTDNKTVLDPEDDAAHVNWGGNWRMPTVAEWQELIDSCFWTTTIMNDVEGFLISEGPAPWMPGEPFIFLPFAGTMEYNYDLETGVYVESEEMRAIGVYWAKDIPQDFSRQVLETMRPFVSVCAGGYFEPTLTTYGFVRVYGMPIRPVCPKE